MAVEQMACEMRLEWSSNNHFPDETNADEYGRSCFDKVEQNLDAPNPDRDETA
jgi:hypothetical protein